jgi:methylenetetrahydrofolate reductase (NADPH)
MKNALAETVAAGRFCCVAELVASGTKTEAQVLEVATALATVPEIGTASVTNYAGGKAGHDPIRIATGVQARGLTANVHITCVSQDRHELKKTIARLQSLELFNVFALTGDYPKDPGTPSVFDVDSVQLVRFIAETRARLSAPFYISVAVSPFKYNREDCLYQYLKLEKKVLAGADLAITQVGWDVKKFVELKRYLDERGLKMPVLGNVYVLGLKAAERMAGGNPPGCWASPELVAAIREESKASDGGLNARLDRAAKTVALLKGLGYAGVYLGGTHDPKQLAHILRRAEDLAPRWEACMADLQFGDAKGFYLYEKSALPKPRPTIIPLTLDAIGKAMPVPWSKSMPDTWLRRRIEGIFTWIDRRPWLNKAFERFEYHGKRVVFGCKNCGNCVLGHMEYVCPQTCPKQMRNGPCGGTYLGKCEVIDQPCIWVSVMERAEATDRLSDLKTYIPPPDRTLQGTSSWLNFYLQRDSRPGRPRGDFASKDAAPESRETSHTAA